jgi:hypothetical protein
MVTERMMVLALLAALGAVFVSRQRLQRLCALIAVWATASVGIYVANEIFKAIDRLVWGTR